MTVSSLRVVCGGVALALTLCAGELNVALYDEHYFGLMVREHRMEAIECVCLPPHHVWLEKRHFALELDLDILRPMVRTIAYVRVCENSV